MVLLTDATIVAEHGTAAAARTAAAAAAATRNADQLTLPPVEHHSLNLSAPHLHLVDLCSYL